MSRRQAAREARFEQPAPERFSWVGPAILAALGVGALCAALWHFWRAEPSAAALDLSGLDLSQLSPPAHGLVVAALERVAEHPDDPEAIGRLGMAFRAQDLEDAAEKCFRAAAELAPTDYRWPYLLAVSLAEDDATAARRPLETAVHLAPDEAAPRLRLAEALLADGDLAAAAEHFAAVLQAHPQNPRALAGQARIYITQGDNAAARAALATACQLAPEQRALRIAFAQVLARLGEAEAAAKEAAAARELPDGPPAWPDPLVGEMLALRRDADSLSHEVANLLENDRSDEALALLQQLAAWQPGETRWSVPLATLLIQRRNYPAAQEFLAQALQRQPLAAELWLQRGVLAYRQAAWPAACQAFERAVELKPDYSDAWYNLGHAREQSGDPAGALAAFERSAQSQSDNLEALANAGRLHLDLGRPAAARDVLLRARELAPQNAALQALWERCESALRGAAVQ